MNRFDVVVKIDDKMSMNGMIFGGNNSSRCAFKRFPFLEMRRRELKVGDERNVSR